VSCQRIYSKQRFRATKPSSFSIHTADVFAESFQLLSNQLSRTEGYPRNVFDPFATVTLSPRLEHMKAPLRSKR
jgi:hypothetical protein